MSKKLNLRGVNQRKMRREMRLRWGRRKIREMIHSGEKLRQKGNIYQRLGLIDPHEAIRAVLVEPEKRIEPIPWWRFW